VCDDATARVPVTGGAGGVDSGQRGGFMDTALARR